MQISTRVGVVQAIAHLLRCREILGTAERARKKGRRGGKSPPPPRGANVTPGENFTRPAIGEQRALLPAGRTFTLQRGVFASGRHFAGISSIPP